MGYKFEAEMWVNHTGISRIIFIRRDKQINGNSKVQFTTATDVNGKRVMCAARNTRTHTQAAD